VKTLAGLLLATTLLAAPAPDFKVQSGKRDFHYAELALNAGHLEDAALAFEDIVRKKPHDMKAKLLLGVTRYWLGLQAEDSGNPARAAHELRAALLLDGGEPYWHSALAEVLSKQGDAAGAAKECAEAARLSPLDAGLAEGCGLKNQKPDNAKQAGPKIFDFSKPHGDLTPPVAVNKPQPPYTRKARDLGCQGTTTLSAVINAAGKVENARVVKPIGFGLDEEALKTVRTWTFRPATRKGRPVPVRFMLEITFRLYDLSRKSPPGIP
jgi:TonB family protein